MFTTEKIESLLFFIKSVGIVWGILLLIIAAIAGFIGITFWLIALNSWQGWLGFTLFLSLIVAISVVIQYS
jgi:hypothetical protein